MGRVTVALVLMASCSCFAHADTGPRRGRDRVDVESTAKILEYTTDPAFLTEWVDYLPASSKVPSPAKFHGYVTGSPDELTQPEDIVAYFRALDKASDRVQVFSIGRSHGGREMIVAAIADAKLLRRLDSIKARNRELADPRVTDEARAKEIAKSTPPVYYITAGLHSPETGPPEMVQELAYRLAVSEQDHIREIRGGVITLITPVLEMDGRARMVDWYRRYLRGHTDLQDMPPRMAPYWGDYTAHDNNRDGLQQSQPLTRNYTDAFYEYLPVLSLDLHESVPLLYVSGGTGPYNESIDPITITEWQWIASYEVSQTTKLGLRGVWTWGFYTGWYPGYLLWVTNNHNAIGRFYETFGNGHPGTFERKLDKAEYADRRLNSRQWYRAWPPEKKITWSLRNNTNYMQTGVLASLQLASRHGEELLMSFWQKGRNAVDKGGREAPYAFVVPAEQRDRGALHKLLWLLSRHRIEVHRAAATAKLGAGDDAPVVKAGDYVVRMDQPYRNFAETLLQKGEFPKSADTTPYDDVAWSLDYMLGVDVKPIAEGSVLAIAMERVIGVPELPGTVEDGSRWIVDHRGQASLASLRWAVPDATVRALAEAWDGHPAGSLVIEGVGADALRAAIEPLHLDAKALASAPNAALVEVDAPRVAVFHTWRYTQDSGWARYTLEKLGVPFTLINKDHLRAGKLRNSFDVIIVPSQGGLDFKGIVHGIDPKWGPMPYTKTDEFPSHGVIDSSDDITGGMGFAGLANLQAFVDDGGVLISLGSGGLLAAEGGIARQVNARGASGTPGSHVTTKVLRPEHPIAWGQPEVTYVFRGNLPIYDVRDYDRGMVVMQFDTKTFAEAEREADKKADIPVDEPPEKKPAKDGGKDGEKDGKDGKPAKKPLALSGIVKDPSKLSRLPAIVDAPVGKGRTIFFSWNPLHRHQNEHDFAFLTNALLFFNDFPAIPTEKEMRAREAEGT
jgi:hypothetical protein